MENSNGHANGQPKPMKEAQALAKMQAARTMYRLVDEVGRVLANVTQAPHWQGHSRAIELMGALGEVVAGKAQSVSPPEWLLARLHAQYATALARGDNHDPRPMLDIIDLDGKGEGWGNWPAYTMAEVLLLEAANLPGHRRYLATMRELGDELEASNEEWRAMHQRVLQMQQQVDKSHALVSEARAHVAAGTTMAERLEKAQAALEQAASK